MEFSEKTTVYRWLIWLAADLCQKLCWVHCRYSEYCFVHYSHAQYVCDCVSYFNNSIVWICRYCILLL